MPRVRLTLLGTGSSGGVPRVGADWGACDPAEPRNRRTRCSALVEQWTTGTHATTVLIDTSPDLREQLLAAGTTHLDAVVYTHDHADQAHGIDDVRALAIRQRRQIPVYFDAATQASLATRFSYIFKGAGGYPPILDMQPVVTPYQRFSVPGPGGPVEFLPVDMEHGRIRCLGFRMGDVAYCNDVNGLPQRTLDALTGLDTLIVDALRYTPHPSHAHLELTLAWIAELKPRRAILTNLHVDLDYRTLQNELPDGVEPAYDGMQIEFSV
ncbi:MBL fold metallo-hydrolase [Hyphomonas sp.]|uniref:MBL fold metallo-hydrolase n=1 Tax=Hyphomonas sp. TaxID=87 RepID=UPI0025BB1156|nr:MBL fold metallo-hydrolase [Hyphomonas sp.]MBI1401535.1 MBL fold metallo-hydrolase [Hyphomonas sp.]